MGIIMTDKEIYQKITAREILNIIEEICFSEHYLEFRVNKGSNGQRDLIIRLIKEKYWV